MIPYFVLTEFIPAIVFAHTIQSFYKVMRPDEVEAVGAVPGGVAADEAAEAIDLHQGEEL